MRRWTPLLCALLLASLWWVLRSGERPAIVPADTAATPVRHVPGPTATDEVHSDGTERTSLPVEADVASVDPEPGERHSSLPRAGLIVRTLHADGSPWPNGHVQVLARFAPRRGMPRGREKRSTHVSVTISAAGPMGHVAASSTDEYGLLEMPDVVPDLPLTVRLVDALGTVVASVSGLSLTAGERREVELRASRSAHALRGRCVDGQGRSMAGVTLAVHALEAEGVGVTFSLNPTVDDDGRFETGPLFAEHVLLQAVFEDHIAIERLAVPVGGEPVEIVLRRGRSLWVVVQDESGRPDPEASLRVHELGGEAPLDVSWERAEGGRRYPLLPGRPLELRWGSPCAPQKQPIGAEDERALVRVPRPGTLWIEVGLLPGDTTAHYAVGVYCLDGPSPVVPLQMVLNTGHQQARWMLAPGRYRVQLLHQPQPEQGTWEPWTPPVEVEVRTGETTFERLGR